MNRFMSYISDYFVRKDINHYPELFHKNDRNLSYTITMAGGSVLFHDTPAIPRRVDWRSI